VTIRVPIIGFVIAVAFFAAPQATSAEKGGVPRFNRDILPILADNCFTCHGSDSATREAGLRLDTEEGARRVLKSEAIAVVPGDRTASAIYQRITASDDDRMPPAESGHELTAAAIEQIGAWIDGGATWEKHWAYIPPASGMPPTVGNTAWPRSAIDKFILARLEQEDLAPSPEAAKRVLLRRLHLDLTGLPPEPGAITTYLSDDSPGAYERLVDGLLTSPHFGEKWARWWLDLAGYADSDGFLSDFHRPQAWRYRQWVVDALNANMPFDQFTIEQVAGDLLPDATPRERMGTGFFRNTLSNREGGADLEDYRTMQATDRVISLGTVWLAETLECARCHDHKYDPISQREFYQFYAFFNNADEVNIDAPLEGQAQAYETAWPTYVAARKALLAPIAEELAELQAQWEEKAQWAADNPGAGDYHWDRAWEVLGLIWGQSFGEGQLEGTYIVRKPIAERTLEERIRLQDYFLSRGSIVNAERFRALGISAIVTKLDELKKKLPPISRAPTLRLAHHPRETRVHIRGDFRTPGETVGFGTPDILHPFETDGASDRLDLARWLVDGRNPLTARVTVNRLWQELFGQGIVATSDDFGVRGGRPSHPELLDWLAAAFVDEEWRIKSLLKTIVMSATYRQQSNARPDLEARDPGNVLLARQTRRRLSAEITRDNALAASGLLHRAIGGPSVHPPQPDSVTEESFDQTWKADEGPNRYRRGLYTFIQRTSPFGQSANFDFPDTNRACTRRERSNTPLQALNLLNDVTFFDAARSLAARVVAECGPDDNARIDRAYLRCVARLPAPFERERLHQFVAEETKRLREDPEAIAAIVSGSDGLFKDAESAAWVMACSVVLNLDEFITKE
jgi:hypothetical protein